MTKKKYLSDEQAAQMASKYTAGASMPELAEEYKLKKNTVYKYLIGQKVKIREGRGRKKEVTEAMVIEAQKMRDQGICWKIVEKRIGMSEFPLSQGMKRMKEGLPV